MLNKKCVLRAYNDAGASSRLLPLHSPKVAIVQGTCVLMLHDWKPNAKGKSTPPKLCAYPLRNTGSPHHGSRIPWKALWCETIP
eukprot:3197274-Prymnesium_polylepis.1